MRFKYIIVPVMKWFFLVFYLFPFELSLICDFRRQQQQPQIAIYFPINISPQLDTQAEEYFAASKHKNLSRSAIHDYCEFTREQRK